MSNVSGKISTPEQQTLFEMPPLADGATRAATKTARSGTFTDNMKLPVHRWFRYSAGFSAEWVQQVVQDLSPGAVLDPFAGSGTTLLAAEAAGVKAYGYESHPFVFRIAGAKAQWDQDEVQLVAASKLITVQATRIESRAATDQVPPLLTKCFTPESLAKLIALRESYMTIASGLQPPIRDLLWLAITSILRACSYVGTAQWQYVLPNKRKSKTVDPLMAFTQKVEEMAADIRVLRAAGCRNDGAIMLHDARNLVRKVPEGGIDLVITSPPYPNNYDYADATRLEMTFWGEIQGWGDLQDSVRQFIIRSCSQHATAERLQLGDLLADPDLESIRGELGRVCNELAVVRQGKSGKKAYHTMIAAYFADLAKVFMSLRSSCSPSSNLCFVVGDSAPYGVYVPAEKWLGELALAAGFRSYHFEKLRDRNVKWKNRKHRVPLHEGRLWIRG